MRSTQLITGSLAVAATSALIGLGAPAGAAGPTEPTTTHERGIVIECTGTIKGRPAYVSLYENDTHTNVIQVLIGDDDRQVGRSREVEAGFLDRRQVFGALEVGGKRAVVEGTAHRVGRRIGVHEEHDDAGEHIVIDGHHRRLATDLELSWRRSTAPLDCDPAFVYDLEVTKTPVV